MRIAIDVSQAVYPTGVGRYTRELVTHLVAIDAVNNYLLFGGSVRLSQTLRNFGKSLGAFNNCQTKFYPIPPTFWELLANRFRLPIEFFVGDVDVFHSSDWAQPKSRAVKITTVHDLAPIKYPHLHDRRIVEVHRRKLELVRKEVDLIIAVSENTKRDLVEQLQIPEGKIRVVYEAAAEIFEPQLADRVAEIREKLGIKKDYLLTVVTVGARKNLSSLLAAFDLLKKEFDLTLVVVGNLIGIKRRDVMTTGFVTDNDLAALYSGARVFVFPSLYEGFGLPVLEAIACGTPVACSQTSSLPEIGGEVAFYFNPNDYQEIYKVVKNVLVLSAHELALLKKRLLAQAQNFSWQKTAQTTLQLYKELASS